MALIDENDTILRELVAKEGRYEEDAEKTWTKQSWSARRKATQDEELRQLAEWHLPFARTQNVARELASEFAAAVEAGYRRWFEAGHAGLPFGLPAELPKLAFIETDIYVVGTNGLRRSYLVEEMLTGEWRKFNNNAVRDVYAAAAAAAAAAATTRLLVHYYCYQYDYYYYYNNNHYY